MEQESERKKNKYDADSIQIFKGLEAVKKRPGMYIGDISNGDGLHHMLYEVIDNSIDEVLAGYARNIWISLLQDGSVSVKDDGRGIPVDKHKEEGISAAEVIMTKLHAGGKFNQNSYKVSGGLHGVGVSVVNALSTWLELTIERDEGKYFLKFKDGIPIKKIEKLEKIKKGITSTEIRFLPSENTFTSIIFDFDRLEKRLRELCFLNKGLRIFFSDQRQNKEKKLEFFYSGGIKEYLGYINNNKTCISPVIYISSFDKSTKITVEAAIQWNNSYYENIFCFTNNIQQKDGGSHLIGLKLSISKAFNSYLSSYDLIKKKEASITGEDIREGMTCILSVKVPNPQFSSQTKDKLVTPEVRTAVDNIVHPNLFTWLELNREDAKSIISKIKEATNARIAARKARELSRKKGSLEISSLPGKLAGCQEKKPSESEVFIVEGESAGGTAKQGRNRKYQAVLPLRGKILNVEKARFDKMLSSEQVGTLINALGTGIGEDGFLIEKARYHKIIIMTDADVDGSHIRTLLLTFFFRHMPQIIEKGYLYIAQPPLYKVKYSNNKDVYLKDEKEFNKYLFNSIIKDDIEINNTENQALNNEEIYNFLSELDNFTKNVNRFFHGKEVVEILAILFANYDFEKNSENIIKIFNQNSRIYNEKFNLSKWQAANENDKLRFVNKKHGIENHFTITLNDLVEGKIARIFAKFDKLLKFFKKQVKIRIKNFQNTHSIPTFLLKETINFASSQIKTQRFKGLGEMNASQLWETTLDPQTRSLVKVNIIDAIEANKIFSNLMGDIVEPRKDFIQKNAIYVQNLDI